MNIVVIKKGDRIMIHDRPVSDSSVHPRPPEDLAAELALAAYEVALKHGLRSPFIEVELELWHRLGAVLDRVPEERNEITI
jgi:hypothetical protein